MTNPWFIFWHVRPVLRSLLVVPQMVSDIAGTIINVKTENIRNVRLVCKNIFFKSLIVKGKMGFYMAFQLYWSIKLMKKILLNKNTTGDIPAKRWHLMGLMLKMISNISSAIINIISFFIIVVVMVIYSSRCYVLSDFWYLIFLLLYIFIKLGSTLL